MDFLRNIWPKQMINLVLSPKKMTMYGNCDICILSSGQLWLICENVFKKHSTKSVQDQIQNVPSRACDFQENILGLI